jgi:hypothetical protein
MLSQEEKENILNEFPNIKLSYENITHKKVYNSDYITALPEGKKCFAWFTTVNNKSVCLIMELITNSRILDITIVNTCFSSELSYGTILYGTVLQYIDNTFFYIEDIYRYKGNDLERITWGEKLSCINKMLKKDLKQIAYNTSFIIFGLPIMCTNNKELENKIKNINYKISIIKFNLFNKINNCLIMTYEKYKEINNNNNNNNKNNNNNNNKNNNNNNNNNNNKNNNNNNNDKNNNNNNDKHNNKEIVFLVKPDFQCDIYHIYSLNNVYHGMLNIPDYNTSVMMNTLFRNIKENANLNALEESDDEDEFENEDICKFVYLDKMYKIVCKFNNKFKKWYPIKLADENAMITSEIYF